MDLFAAEAVGNDKQNKATTTCIRQIRCLKHLAYRTQLLQSYSDRKEAKTLGAVVEGMENALYYWAVITYLISRGLPEYKNQDLTYFTGLTELETLFGMAEAPTTEALASLFVETQKSSLRILYLCREYLEDTGAAKKAVIAFHENFKENKALLIKLYPNAFQDYR